MFVLFIIPCGKNCHTIVVVLLIARHQSVAIRHGMPSFWHIGIALSPICAVLRHSRYAQESLL